MSLQETLFWVLSAAVILCAIGVITSKNPINSVLFLIGTFFAITGHYILLNAQFLAIVNIIVYAGAIMVLFLFVLMQVNLNVETEAKKGNLIKFAGVIAGGLLLIVMIAAIKKADVSIMAASSTDIGLIQNLGHALFHDYVLPFEVSSILFLSAMVGAVVIGKKE